MRSWTLLDIKDGGKPVDVELWILAQTYWDAHVKRSGTAITPNPCSRCSRHDAQYGATCRPCYVLLRAVALLKELGAWSDDAPYDGKEWPGITLGGPDI